MGSYLEGSVPTLPIYVYDYASRELIYGFRLRVGATAPAPRDIIQHQEEGKACHYRVYERVFVTADHYREDFLKLFVLPVGTHDDLQPL